MNDNKLMGCIGVIFTIVFVLVVGTIGNGWALSVLWGWFVVSIFDLPALTLVQALGIGLIVSFFTNDLQKEDNAGKDLNYAEKLVYTCIMVILKPLIYISLGWIYLQFM